MFKHLDPVATCWGNADSSPIPGLEGDTSSGLTLETFHSEDGLTLETSASLSLHGQNLTVANLFDTKIDCFTSHRGRGTKVTLEVTVHSFNTFLSSTLVLCD